MEPVYTGLPFLVKQKSVDAAPMSIINEPISFSSAFRRNDDEAIISEIIYFGCNPDSIIIDFTKSI